jgi:hypothetical protein
MPGKPTFVAAIAILVASLAAPPALAEKAGGTLRVYHRDNAPSGSIHEEATISTVQPFMAVFNNLVVFDPKEKVNSPDKIVPDLAESWSWNDDKTKLTFAAPGRQVARRQALHRQGRQMHLGSAHRQGGEPAAQEPAACVVPQPQGGLGQRRP